MGIKFIFIGLLFFTNPNIGLFDFLPDIFGCFFIIYGLHKLSDIDGRFYQARRVTYYMTATFAIKLVLTLYTIIFSKANIMPFSFLFSVAESILFVWFFTNLYSGLEYICSRHGGEKHLNYSKNASITAYLFIILRSIFSFLPYSLDLFTNLIIKKLFPYMTLLSILVVTIVGICFIIVSYRYFLSLDNDKEFNNKLFQIYKLDILDNTELVIKRKTNTFLTFLILGFIFMFDFTIDGINLLPDFLGYIFIAIGFFFILKNKSKLVLPMVLIIYSIGTYAFKTFTNFSLNNAFKVESFFSYRYEFVVTGSAFLYSIIISLVEAVLLIVFLHTVFTFLLNLTESFEKRVDIHLEIKISKIVCSAFSILSALCFSIPLATAFCYYQKDLALNESVRSYYLNRANTLDTINIIFGIILIIATILQIYFGYRIKRKLNFEIYN